MVDMYVCLSLLNLVCLILTISMVLIFRSWVLQFIVRREGNQNCSVSSECLFKHLLLK